MTLFVTKNSPITCPKTTNVRKRLIRLVVFIKNSLLNFIYHLKTITFASQKNNVIFFNNHVCKKNKRIEG